MIELTEKQAEVLAFIKSFINLRGFPPTNVEMASRFDVQPNAIQVRINALIKKGAVHRTENKMRSIQPVKGFRVRIKA